MIDEIKKNFIHYSKHALLENILSNSPCTLSTPPPVPSVALLWTTQSKPTSSQGEEAVGPHALKRKVLHKCFNDVYCIYSRKKNDTSMHKFSYLLPCVILRANTWGKKKAMLKSWTQFFFASQGLFHHVIYEAQAPGLCTAPVFDNRVDESIWGTRKAGLPTEQHRAAGAQSASS